MRKHLLAILLLATAMPAFAQKPANDSISAKDSAEVPYSHFNASLDFVNNYVWVGRPAKTAFPYLTPALSWTHKSGAYIGGALSFLTKPDESQLDITYLTAGYDHSFGDFEGSLEANKYWYNKNSQNPKSDINWDLTATGIYPVGPVNVSASVYAMFSKKATDYGAMLSLDHSFFFLDESLEVAPTLMLIAGSTKYLGKNFFRHFEPPNQTGVTYDVTGDLSDASRFKVLDLELTVPVSYYFNKFTFYFNPTVAFPLNPATATIQIIPSNAPPRPPRQVTEKLNTVFFFSVGVEYEF